MPGLRLGTGTLNTDSRKRSVEVWSKVSEQTNGVASGVGFRLNGETTSMGTRKPTPIGSRYWPLPDSAKAGRVGEGARGMYSPAGRIGGGGGGRRAQRP